MLKSVLSAAAVLLTSAASGAAAQQVTYRCEISNRSGNGFVSKTMFFTLDRAKSAGLVYDGLIHATKKAPLPAQVTKRSSTVWRYKWRVDDVPTNNTGTVSLRYSANLNIGTGRVSVSGGIGGLDNDIFGSGRCAVVKG